MKGELAGSGGSSGVGIGIGRPALSDFAEHVRNREGSDFRRSDTDLPAVVGLRTRVRTGEEGPHAAIGDRVVGARRIARRA